MRLLDALFPNLADLSTQNLTELVDADPIQGHRVRGVCCLTKYCCGLWRILGNPNQTLVRLLALELIRGLCHVSVIRMMLCLVISRKSLRHLETTVILFLAVANNASEKLLSFKFLFWLGSLSYRNLLRVLVLLEQTGKGTFFVILFLDGISIWKYCAHISCWVLLRSYGLQTAARHHSVVLILVSRIGGYMLAAGESTEHSIVIVSHLSIPEQCWRGPLRHTIVLLIARHQQPIAIQLIYRLLVHWLLARIPMRLL